MRLGSIGVWLGAFTVAPAAEARPAAREIEELGYDTLWYPEGLGTRESFSNGAVLLGATERLRVASGIANIWARDAVSAANAARVLADAFDDRSSPMKSHWDYRLLPHLPALAVGTPDRSRKTAPSWRPPVAQWPVAQCS